MSKHFKDKRVQKTAIALAVATAFSSATALAAVEEVEAASAEDVEVIEVYGIAGSLAESARQKRFSNRIVDAIVAEDIGKLPDNNIAEALQRITGVSISSDFGVGESVTIRGISDNRVELNGRSTAGEGRGGISLDDFPSSFLKTIEVVKSPTPEMIEGALGGTVNMKTIRPLELDETLAAFTYDMEYADKTEHKAPKFTGSAGSNWSLDEHGTFGASVMFSYLDRELRQDEFINLHTLEDIDLDGDGNVDQCNTPQGTCIVRSQNTVNQKTEQRERTAYGLTLQWAPQSDNGNIYLELNGTDLKGGQQSYSILDVLGNVAVDSSTYQDSNGVLNNYTLENVILIPKTISDFSETTTYQHAIGGEWTLSDKLSVSGEFAINKSETDRVDSEFTLRPVEKDAWYENGGFSNDTQHYVDAYVSQNGGGLPSVVYSDSQALLNPENLALRTFQNDTDYVTNEETASRLDFEYLEPFDIDWISKVKTGVRVTSRDYEFSRSDYIAKDIYKKAYYVDENGDATGEKFSIWVDDMEALNPGKFATINPNASFDQLGLSGQNDLLEYLVYDGLALGDADQTFLMVQSMLEGTNLATTGTLQDNLELDEGEYKRIEEETRALYLQFELDFDDITAVVGGRYVETELDSTIMEDGDFVTGENDYSDFLPSLNVTYHLYDDTLVRFAAAKVMRRAGFGDLSPAYSVDTSLVSATQGSVGLDPYRVTQYDLGIEHYFGEGGLLSAAVFYKDVESFTKQQNTCVANGDTVEQQNVEEWKSVCILDEAGVDNGDIVTADPSMSNGFEYVDGLRAQGLTGINTATEVNGGSGKIQGIELAYQQQFAFLPGIWSGTGVSTNYTWADSEQPDGTQMENISEHTYNAQAYWEYEGFQVRVAYNWRDDYLASVNEKRIRAIGAEGYGIDNNDNPEGAGYDPTAGNSYREARGQFDFSASWDYNEHFTVVANAVNFTGEPLVFKTELGNDWMYREADRRYTIGIRAKF